MPATELIGELPILQRSPEVTRLLSTEANRFKQNSSKYDGLIYIVYTLSQSRIEPVYIGKATSLCDPNSMALSTASVVPERWSYKNGHLKGLSESLHRDSNSLDTTRKYDRWVETLFTGDRSSLKQSVYLWTQCWGSENTGPYSPYTGVIPTLAELEYRLIGLTYSLFPERLLNNEGVPENPEAYASMRGWIDQGFRQLDDFF